MRISARHLGARAMHLIVGLLGAAVSHAASPELADGLPGSLAVKLDTRLIAVIMPNSQSIGSNTTNPWTKFRVSVRQVESLTGYTFFTNVRPMVRRLIKLRADTQ